MRRTPIRIAGLCALAVTMATSVAACGNDDKKTACDKLRDTITQVSQSGVSQNNDPNGLANSYYSSCHDDAAGGPRLRRQRRRERGERRRARRSNSSVSS